MFCPQRVVLVLVLLVLSPVSGQVGAPAAPGAPPGGAPPPSPQLAPEVVATVNGRPITAQDVTRKLLERYGRAALQVLMVDAALADAAERAGVGVTDEEVAARLARAEQSQKGRTELRRRLAEQGVTVAQFRSDLRRELLIEKLLESRGTLTVSQQDVQQMYQRRYGERLELAMILVETEAEAKEVEGLLAQGADFGRLARERSRDRVSGPASGRLGQVVRGDLLPELQDAVFALPSGGLSRPMLTRYGYHIFKVLERLPAQEVPLEDVRAELVEAARQQKLAVQRSALVAEVLRQADIAVNTADYPWVRPPATASVK